MLPKKNRLTKTKDFQAIFKGGRVVFSPILVLKYKKDQKTNKNSLFGFVVSNKIAKKTTVRNRLKRQMRQIVYNKIKDISPNSICVIIARSKIREANFQFIEKSITGVLKRAGLIINNWSFLKWKRLF